MLRKIVQVGRRVQENSSAGGDCSSSSSSSSSSGSSLASEDLLEPWLDWFRRSTHTADELAVRHGVCDWVEECRRRKWKLAGHTLRRTDGRWSTRLLNWIPNAGHRDVGHPAQRWSDELAVFHKRLYGNPYWSVAAMERETWNMLEEDFASRRWL